MLRLDRVIKPWKESAALNDHINLYGFWNDTTFLTKSGDLGMVLQIQGVDYESLDSVEQEYAVKRLEAALKAFDAGFHVYQYLFKSNRPDIPFANYEDPVVEAAIDQRRRFFESKREDLYEIEIFYVVMLEGARSKRGVGAAIGRFFHDPAGAIEELRAQFTNNSMKTLLTAQIEADLARLDQRVQAFNRQLADFVSISVLDKASQLTFLRRLLNYDDCRIAGKPQSTQFLDYQVVNSNIEAERDHLRVGGHFVRVLTMKEAITETRPLVLDSLLKIPASFMVCTEWTPLPTDKARKEVNKRRRHFNMSKTGFVSQIGNDASKTNPRDVLVDESKQADIENLGDCLRALGDGQSLGDFSLSIVLHGASKQALDQLAGEFTSVFTNADGNLFTETYNQLNAYFATVPGNYALNLRKLYLLNSNYADLSFLFTILPGERRNAHLGTEYLAVLETENSTPYFLNLHNGEVAHTLILGMTGSGKSYFCNFLLQNAQKYAPLTFIFDIGGSFQSLTTIFGGSYLNVGQDTRDFTINPFSLAPTKENLQFLFSFFRVLIEGTEQRYRLDFKEERKLWDAIERVYVLEPGQRTISSFVNIIGELKERLHRWTEGGQYGFVFDNPEDTLSFSSFQTFNFAGWGDAPEVLEPLLFYVLHRASNEIANPQKLATFKMFLLDEAWLFIKNETIRTYIVQAQKTWRKHNAAMILATQSIKELEESGMLQIVSESCPTKIFLANPEMDRDLYREAFHLNDTELELIAGLVPPGQMLIRKAQSSKKVQLNVDSVSHWTATNNARDNLRKREYFERYGIADGLRRLAEDHPFRPRTMAVSSTTNR
ncbi:VirB4 family type IV secretion system protein [Granulicella mallensis]|uniref:Type IV secretion system protein VirB4 n=1 Tax=Granulicella mallensis TaxID=940614 RepID=A0A7W7ZMW1_9BACT|nr:type IV secretion system DNA-binding domain-containing protein [Granulicella mallensis]MBB5062519.1 type IV secretion system protein VirB4 [Granulicella mallensis]